MRNKMMVMITSADFPGLCRQLTNENIILHDIQQTDNLSFTCEIYCRDYNTVLKYIDNHGGTLKIIKNKGIGNVMRLFYQRPIFTAGMLILIMLSVWLPTRILFVEVTGNNDVSSRLILEEAGNCGIHLGASRRAVRSERVKNNLLSALPDLQWAGINTYGCVAEISVREKARTNTLPQNSYGAGNIIAVRDGVVTACIVRNGNQLCELGQAVKAGQVLVSGYTELGTVIRTTEAEAEIMADTFRNLQTVLPATSTSRTREIARSTKISVLIGKKLINFSKDSGISDAMCVKMYSKKYLTLPGGRTLPVALVIERNKFYETTTSLTDPVSVNSLLERHARQYLVDQMISGEVLYAKTEFTSADGYYCLRGKYTCNELIGKFVREERFYDNGENG